VAHRTGAALLQLLKVL